VKLRLVVEMKKPENKSINSFEELEINIEGYPKLEMCRSLVILQTSHKERI
jgi:hypothetical protein